MPNFKVVLICILATAIAGCSSERYRKGKAKDAPEVVMDKLASAIISRQEANPNVDKFSELALEEKSLVFHATGISALQVIDAAAIGLPFSTLENVDTLDIYVIDGHLNGARSFALMISGELKTLEAPSADGESEVASTEVGDEPVETQSSEAEAAEKFEVVFYSTSHEAKDGKLFINMQSEDSNFTSLLQLVTSDVDAKKRSTLNTAIQLKIFTRALEASGYGQAIEEGKIPTLTVAQ